MNTSHNWNQAIHSLRLWHEQGERQHAEKALVFFEIQLRLHLPSIHRRWSHEQINDAIQSFLERLLKTPLPEPVSYPKAYLNRAFNNWCIDIECGCKRHFTELLEEEHVAPEEPAIEIREQLERMTRALNLLPIKDRVALKMREAPFTMSREEISWIARRGDLTVNEVSERLFSYPSLLDLTLLFDPGPAPQDKKERRDRLERFRMRCTRAQKKIRVIVEADR